MGGWCAYTAGVCHGRLVCLHCRRLGQPRVCQERLLSVHCPSLLSDAPSPGEGQRKGKEEKEPGDRRSAGVLLMDKMTHQLENWR